MLGLSPLWNAALHAGGDPVIQAGGLYLTDPANSYTRPGLPCIRTGTYYLPQRDGSMALVPENTPGRYWDSALGMWLYRNDPGWTQYSQWSLDITQAAWTKTRCGASNVGFANPLGGSVISKITEDTSAGLSHLTQSSVTTSVAGVSYTARAILYADERKHAALCFTGGGGGTDRGVFVDLLTGSITGAFGSYPASYGASLRADGGVDVFITESAPGAAGYAARVYLCSAQNVSVYTGDGGSGLRVAVLNLTNTAYPAPFSVAQGSAVTIGAQNWTGALSALGITLGGEYTIGADWVPVAADASFGTVLRLDNGSSAERAIIRRNQLASFSSSAVVAAGNIEQYTATRAGNAGGLRKQAMRVKANDMRSVVNGVVMANDDGASTMPAVDRVCIGHGVNSTSEVFIGGIGRTWIIPTAGAPDSLLQALAA